MMLTELQAKMAVFFGGLVILLVSNLGSYLYGHSVGVELQEGKQAKVEVGRVSNVATAAIAHTGAVVAGVQQDNLNERKANENLDKANVELAKTRTENRALIRELGGLRISVPAGTGCDPAPGQAQTAGASGNDGTVARTIALPEQVATDLQDGVDEADIILERLRVLRDWARVQGFDGPSTGEPVIPDGPDIPIR